MIIEIDDVAKEWIASKGGQVTIKNLEVKACCAPGVQELIALPGKPKTLSGYHQVSSNQVMFYIQRNVPTQGKISLTLSGFPFLKSLDVKLK